MQGFLPGDSMTPQNVFWGEVVGTFLLILLGVGVNANVLLNRSKGQQGGWIVLAFGWGFAVAIGVYVAGWASGGHLNPAVTLGLSIAGKSPWHLAPFYCLAQIIGAILGALAAWFVYYPHWGVTPDPETKLVCFATKPAIRRFGWNFVTEFIATAVLMMGVLGIFNTHNEIASGVGPYAVGILIVAIGISLGGPTGYAINPVRDLGPRMIHALVPMKNKGSSDWSYAWIPILAPLLGSAVGAWIYQLLIAPLKLIGEFN